MWWPIYHTSSPVMKFNKHYRSYLVGAQLIGPAPIDRPGVGIAVPLPFTLSMGAIFEYGGRSIGAGRDQSAPTEILLFFQCHYMEESNYALTTTRLRLSLWTC